MRELSAEARLHLYARSLSRKTGPGIQAAALYGALALIAAVIFGSLSVHPFLCGGSEVRIIIAASSSCGLLNQKPH
jgi:hypothetical protein